MHQIFYAVLTTCLILIGVIGVTNYQHQETDCANSISCTKDLSGNFDENAKNAEFEGDTLPVPTKTASLVETTIPNVLGAHDSNKRIEIDLTNQRLYAYEGDKKIFDFLVSTGKWGRTPIGTFRIWIKLRYTRMEGGSQELGTYYNLPNVPYTMYFYNADIPKWRGFGIHGTYWHDNFGTPMSHGCINMKTEEVEQLYYWAEPQSAKFTTYATEENPGTQIIIYGEAPYE